METLRTVCSLPQSVSLVAMRFGFDMRAVSNLTCLCQNHLVQLKKQFRKLRTEITDLRRQNEELTQDLDKAREDAAENEAPPKRGRKAGPTVASLQKDISALKTRIQKYEKVCRVFIHAFLQLLMLRYRPKIEKKDKKLIKQVRITTCPIDAGTYPLTPVSPLIASAERAQERGGRLAKQCGGDFGTGRFGISTTQSDCSHHGDPTRH